MDHIDDIADALVMCHLVEGVQPPSLRTRIKIHQSEPARRVVLGKREDGVIFCAFGQPSWADALTALGAASSAPELLAYARSGDLGRFTTVPRAFLVELLEQSKRLVLCGHGAGGAAAALAGAFLALECEDASKGLTPEAVASGEEALKLKERVSIVTFGGLSCAPWGPVLAARLREAGVAGATTHVLRDDDVVAGLHFAAGAKLPPAPSAVQRGRGSSPTMPTTAKEAADTARAVVREAREAAAAEAARVGDAVKTAAVSKSLGAVQAALFSSGALAGASYPLLMKLFTPGPSPPDSSPCRPFPGTVHVLSEPAGGPARFFRLPAEEDALQLLAECLAQMPATAVHAARAAVEKHALAAYAAAFIAVTSPASPAPAVPSPPADVEVVAAGPIVEVRVEAIEVSARHTKDQCIVRVAARGSGLSQIMEASLEPSVPPSRSLQRLGYAPAAPAASRCLVLEAPMPAGWRLAVGADARDGIALRLAGPFASAAVAATTRALRDSPQLRARVGRLGASAVVECAAAVVLLELLSEPRPAIPAPALAPAPPAAEGDDPPPRLSRWAGDAVEKLDKGVTSLHAEDFATYCTRQLFEYLSAHERHRHRRQLQAAAAQATEAALAAVASAVPDAAAAEGPAGEEGAPAGAGAGEVPEVTRASGRELVEGPTGALLRSLAFLSASLPAGLVPLHAPDRAAARAAFADAARALEPGPLRTRVEALPALFRDAAVQLAFAERERLLAGLSRCSFAALAAALARAGAGPEAALLADDLVFLSALLTHVLDGPESRWIVGPAAGGAAAAAGPRSFFKTLLEEVREGGPRPPPAPIQGPSYTHRLFALAAAHNMPPSLDDSYCESRLINSAHFGDVKLVYLLRQAVWSAPPLTLALGARASGKSALLRLLLGPAAVPAGPSRPVRAYLLDGAPPTAAAELSLDPRAGGEEAVRPRRLAHGLLPAAALVLAAVDCKAAAGGEEAAVEAGALLRQAAALGVPAAAVLTHCDALYEPDAEERVEKFQSAVKAAHDRMRAMVGHDVALFPAVLSAEPDAFITLAPEGVPISGPKQLLPALRALTA